MFLKLVLKWIISFILKQLEKVNGQLDWDALSHEVDAKLRDLLPAFIADEAIAMAQAVLDVAQRALSDQDALRKVLELLASKDYLAAAIALRDLILAAWSDTEQDDDQCDRVTAFAHVPALLAEIV